MLYWDVDLYSNTVQYHTHTVQVFKCGVEIQIPVQCVICVLNILYAVCCSTVSHSYNVSYSAVHVLTCLHRIVQLGCYEYI